MTSDLWESSCGPLNDFCVWTFSRRFYSGTVYHQHGFSYQTTTFSQTFATCLTGIWFLPCIHCIIPFIPDEADNLFLQVLQFYSVPHLRGFWCGPTPYSKIFPTCFTWIWFFTCVSFHMGQEITIFTKMFPTSFTMIWFLICVDSSWWTFSYRLFHKCHMSQSFYQYQCYTGSDST